MLTAEDLNEEIDLSNVPVYDVSSVTTCRGNHVVTCKELIDMLDRINKHEKYLTEAKEGLTKKLNEFLDRV
jgi:hypothetical protein